MTCYSHVKIKIQNVLTLKCLLQFFEVASRLKVIFYDNKLGRIGVHNDHLNCFFVILNYTKMSMPFTYFKIRGNPRKLKMWDTMIHKIRKKLM